MTSSPPDADALEPAEGLQLGRSSFRNAAGLAVALGVSWTLAFGGQALIRRKLGTSLFGDLSFIESIVLLVASSLSLGIDTYIRREVTLRPGHAAEFARPLLRIRAAALGVLSITAGVWFGLTSHSMSRAWLAAVFCLAQGVVVLGQTSAAYLHASDQMRGIMTSSVVVKVIWLAAVVLLLLGPSPIFAAPVALLASELVRNVWLRHLAPVHDATASYGAALQVVRRSIPYSLDSINLAFTGYAVPAVLGFVATKEESGFFSTARQLMSVPMFFLPILSWVLTPVFARLFHHSREQLWTRVGDLLQVALTPLLCTASAIIPLIRPVTTLIFGAEFGASVRPSALLALGITPTFLTVVLAGALIAEGRAWTVTTVNLVTMVGMVVTSTVAVSLVSATARGDASAAGALALVLWEVITCVVLWRLGRLAPPVPRVAFELALAFAGGIVLAIDELGDHRSAPRIVVGLAMIAVALAMSMPRALRLVRDLTRPVVTDI